MYRKNIDFNRIAHNLANGTPISTTLDTQETHKPGDTILLYQNDDTITHEAHIINYDPTTGEAILSPHSATTFSTLPENTQNIITERARTQNTTPENIIRAALNTHFNTLNLTSKPDDTYAPEETLEQVISSTGLNWSDTAELILNVERATLVQWLTNPQETPSDHRTALYNLQQCLTTEATQDELTLLLTKKDSNNRNLYQQILEQNKPQTDTTITGWNITDESEIVFTNEDNEPLFVTEIGENERKLAEHILLRDPEKAEEYLTQKEITHWSIRMSDEHDNLPVISFTHNGKLLAYLLGSQDNLSNLEKTVSKNVKKPLTFGKKIGKWWNQHKVMRVFLILILLPIPAAFIYSIVNVNM